MKALRNSFLCLVLLCGAVVLMAQAPQWQWAVQAGGMGWNEGHSIVIDSQGNQYVSGRFEYTASFGTHTLTSNGYWDIFVAKLDPSGNWLWVVQAGGEGDDSVNDIVLDASGNAYLTGYISGTATFGNHSLTGNGGFVAKLDPSGNWLWAVNAGDTVSGIALDGMGNAYVTGVFYDSATFGSHSLIANRRINFFAAKLDPDGNWLWAVNAEGTGDIWGNSIALDGTGNAYVTGGFYGVASFGSHTLTASFAEFDTDIFVAKLGNGTPVEDELAPQALARLHNAYPNPLGRGGRALIKAEIPERSTATLNIFNLRGQIVSRHKLGSGSQQVTFCGKGLPAGVYLYSLQCGNYRETRKLVLLK
jgi:hypothetical protein